MPSRTRARSAASRTEARRRARLEARGEPSDEELEEEPDEPERRPSGGFLRLLFPPAPPLAGKPDPMAGFTGSGWARPILAVVHLLRANPLVWLGFGVLSGAGYLLSLQMGTQALGFVATIVTFGSLSAAGWFGWQRPGLYGAAAGIVGYLLATAVVLTLYATQVTGSDSAPPPGQVISSLAIQGLYQAAFGFLAGWYGGYLRRRQAALPTAVRRQRR